MTLTSRVSAFFLLALGACLIGYSAAMYGLIREHLLHQFDTQLASAINVLVAAVEVESDEVKWQPSDHTITLGDERDDDEVRWIIVDEHKRIVDHSPNLQNPTSADEQLLRIAQLEHPSSAEIQDSHQWRYLQHHLFCTDPKPVDERDFDEFGEVVVTVARSSAAMHADIWRLGLLACILPVILWSLAAIAGRAYCRRALHPLGAMASRARSMTNVDFDLRLPVSNQQDELSSLATAFNSLLNRLQQAYQQQQRFTGDAAHQLRTPLTILRGQIDVALRRPRNAEDYRNLLGLLSEQTNELQEIVETLLFLVRNEGDHPAPDQQHIELDHWLPEYLDHWKSHPRYGDLSLEIDGHPQLLASNSLLRQALENLISNALKYSPQGSPVLVRAVASQGLTQISVEDRGGGIPVEEREAIFDPFFRSSSARQTGVPGTGLGLSIVARIASVLNGTVKYDPAIPHGSRFTLQFPFASQPDPVALSSRYVVGSR